jgi:hypothetical protein
LGEHLPCKQGVMSSNLIISTTLQRTVNRKQVGAENGSGEESGAKSGLTSEI